MELPNIGKQCSKGLCNALDFLPIKCEFCCEIFCKDHSSRNHHECVEAPDEVNKKSGGPIITYPCSLSTCKNTELTPVSCPKCLNNFCLLHRHQVDHDCTEYEAPSNPMAEAAAKIQKLVDQSPSEPKRNKKIKNEKLAAKVQLMKLKGKAKGAQQLPMEERIFFLVSSKSFPAGQESVPVFVSHYWSVGRALDAIADLAKVPNKNNDVKAPRLELFRSSDGFLLRPLDATLKELVEKEEIFNGQSLSIDYVQ